MSVSMIILCSKKGKRFHKQSKITPDYRRRMHRAITRIFPRYGGLEIRESDCSYVWQIAVDKRCEWVKNQESCNADSIIQYSQLLFCTFTSEFHQNAIFALGLSIIVLWLFYLFLILATTADNFFCPSLAVIANVLRLSENIAGVTILAFGNGAPDIFTSLASDQHEMVIMFTELIGAGIFLTAVVAGSIAVFAPPFRIPLKSFTRDSSFYVFSVCWISFITKDQVVHLWEALSFIGIYILFIVAVIAMQFYESSENKLKERIPRFRDPDVLKTYVAFQSRKSDLHHNKIPLRPRAYSLQAKLDVAIATEIKSNKPKNRMSAVEENDSTDFGPNRNRGLLRDFLYNLTPISPEEWRDSNVFLKILLIVRAPPMFILQLLVPVVNETAERRGWSKLLNCLQLFITPVVSLFILNVWRSSIGPLPILPTVIVLSIIIASYVFIKTEVETCPKYHNIFAFLGFLGAMLIVYVTANEVMAVLECIGYASGISEAMLGITLLAWGNSIGDLISNVAVARRGFPRMGYSACFGGPLFNTLLGLGMSWAIAASRNPDYRTKIRSSDMMPGCLTFLLASLVASIIYLNIVGFLARRSYGYLLYCIYFVFLLLNFLSEIHFIHPLGTDHRDEDA